jgi:hypothetical protein
VADDALTSIVPATEAPLLLAPAMNGKMWMHPRDGCKPPKSSNNAAPLSSAR